MSKPKKPRHKKHTARLVQVPAIFLIARVPDKYPHLATSLYGQIISFCERPSFETSNNLSRQLACIAGGMSYMNKGEAIRGKRDPASIAICSAIACIESICHRYERTGAVSVTALDIQTMHAAAGRLDEVLTAMPLACYERGAGEADMWLKESNEPVLEVA